MEAKELELHLKVGSFQATEASKKENPIFV